MNEKQTISQFGSQFYQHKFLTNSVHEEKCVSVNSLVVTYVLPPLCKMPALMHSVMSFSFLFKPMIFLSNDFQQETSQERESATFSDQ